MSVVLLGLGKKMKIIKNGGKKKMEMEKVKNENEEKNGGKMQKWKNVENGKKTYAESITTTLIPHLSHMSIGIKK